jgi:folate-binding protein YgfZ
MDQRQNSTPATGQLGDRAVIMVAGAEAKKFLQGLVTTDVDGLAPDRSVYGALLTPQGKILFDLFIHDGDQGYFVDCAAGRRDELIGKLKFYRLRAKIEIAARDDLAVQVGTVGVPDPRVATMGARFIAPPGAACDMTAYGARRIALGLADSVADLGSGEFYPHEANLDQLNGVSFTKGCYVGQEVVSRMEHRGSARSRILPVECQGPALAKGSEIVGGDRPLGTMLSSVGRKALAILRLDRLKEALDAGQRPMAGGQALEVIKPAWARYDVPGAKET